jgi:GxxExxY protein
MSDMEEEQLTKQIIGCCFKVHRELGPGFIEKIYHAALKLAFKEEGLRFQTEKEFEVSYFKATSWYLQSRFSRGKQSGS